MMELLVHVFRLSLPQVMLNMKTLWLWLIRCSISYQLILQQQACWLLRNRPLLLGLRCALSFFTIYLFVPFVMNAHLPYQMHAYLIIVYFNRFG